MTAHSYESARRKYPANHPWRVKTEADQRRMRPERELRLRAADARVRVERLKRVREMEGEWA